jgi:hypothetical protein
MMDDFNTETDSDYTSYWRDWVSTTFCLLFPFSPDLEISVLCRSGDMRGRDKGGCGRWRQGR